MSVQDKFIKLGIANAPGQERRQETTGIEKLLRGEAIAGNSVDFSHGDVDAHQPSPGSLEAFSKGVALGGSQAYTEYCGDLEIREKVGTRLATFTGAAVDAQEGLIVTPGTQGALFLAVAATVSRGDKVAIVQPDYFANRKLVEFLDGEIIPVQLAYSQADYGQAALGLEQLEEAFKAGAKVFIFSNPNNPSGVVYSSEEIRQIAELSGRYGVTVIVDQLYSRLCYEGTIYTHLRAMDVDEENVVTIMGPSKTESLSGYRLGVAFGSKAIINRMEKLQAIVSLRAAGYSQAVLNTWFAEPAGWMEERISQHRVIRDDLLKTFRTIEGCSVRMPEAGSYLFPQLPKLSISIADFVKTLRVLAKVSVTPGTEFSPYASDSVRLNFSQNHNAAVSAVERLSTVIERYRA